MSKTILYVRVSTSEQTSSHQLIQARAAGYEIDAENVITDHGVSGISTKLEDRPQGKRLFDLLREGDVLLVRWIDRLGRNYDDVKEAIETFNKRGVTVKTVINNMTFLSDAALGDDDTGKAVRNALLGFMAAMASADAKAKAEARQAGIKHVLNSPEANKKYRGKRPTYDRCKFNLVQTMLACGSYTMSAIANEAGLSRQTVLRIRDNPEAAEAALVKWNM